MKKFLFGILSVFVLALFTSCELSTSDIEESTKELIIQKFKEGGQKLVINDLKLIHVSGNNYKGLCECAVDGQKIQLDVSVVCDGKNIQAEWEPTAEYKQKIIEDAFDKAGQEIDKAFDEAQKEFENALDEAADEALDESFAE